MATDAQPEDVDRVVKEVAATKGKWAGLGAREKLQLLLQIRGNLEALVDEWAAASARGHGYDPANPEHGHLVAEVYVKGPAQLGNWLTATIALYESLASTGSPPAPLAVRTTPSGALLATVFPKGPLETVFSGGMKADVCVEVPGGAAAVEQENPLTLPAALAGLLAAGNFEAPIDVLHVMFLRNQAAVMKTNPVNCKGIAVLERILAPLVSQHYLAFLGGGVSIGQILTAHPLVDRLLLTGSCRAYDAIMWGSTPEEQKANKAAGKRMLTKEFDAELGSVNPYIICPGVWTEKQLEAHAQQLVSYKMFNNGHICASPQIVVTCKNWPQRAAFLQRVRALLSRYPPTLPYYPNCQRSYDTQLTHSSAANVCANPSAFPGQQHPLFTTDLPKDHFLTQNEAFCPVLGEVPLDTPPTADAFLPAAVEYANTACWGSLTLTLIVDPTTQKTYKAAVEAAVDGLRFGAISVNQGAMMNVLFGQLPWGAYPRHPAEDIRSGCGKVGNTFMLKHATKSITWGPFTHPAQPTLPASPAARLKRDQIFARYCINPSTLRLLRLLAVILTGW